MISVKAFAFVSPHFIIKEAGQPISFIPINRYFGKTGASKAIPARRKGKTARDIANKILRQAQKELENV